MQPITSANMTRMTKKAKTAADLEEFLRRAREPQPGERVHMAKP